MRDSMPLKQAKEWAADRPEITSVSLGYRYRKGKRTEEIAIVFGVKRKRPITEVSDDQRIPALFGGLGVQVNTDVIEAEYEALALTAKRRPCPAGFSIGHVNISAGTFGAPVLRGTDPRLHILTNNHVAAVSNDASPGDRILQPGKADAGQDPADLIAHLTDFVTINFPDEAPKKKPKLAKLYWKVVRSLAAIPPRLVRCPMRLQVRPLAVEQPDPNLVDAAICLPLDDAILDELIFIGHLQGIRDLVLGDKVQKVGRTTEHTFGQVEATNGQVTVNYGGGKQARFDGQVFIRTEDGTDFSAGGDSGSGIVTMDGFLGGLLFAGGGGQTIANRISDVVALLGVRV